MIQADPDPFGTAVAEAPRKPAKPKPPVIEANYTGPIAFVIYGQPASKANSRQIVTIADRPQVIKSKEARDYEKNAVLQIPPKARVQLQGRVKVTLRIFYASERPDLDESVVLDVLQDRWTRDKATNERVLIQRGVYCNDRQVREKHVFHGIDKVNPRTEVLVESIEPQGALL